LETEEGKNVLVHLWIGKDYSYLTNGMIVAKSLNIVEPTNVKLNYLIEGNRFKLTFLPNEPIPYTNPTSTTTLATMSNGQPTNQVNVASNFDPTIHNINFLDLNFHGGYTWEKIVTKAQASKKKNQTLVCKHLPLFFRLHMYSCVLIQ
jgi:hypothetical protein